MKNNNLLAKLGVTLALFVAPAHHADAQAATAANAANGHEDVVVELSPFVVSSRGDEGYRAANTLAGSRMNTPLSQTPAAISVLTKELLDDIGAENTEQILTFAVNADREFGSDATGLGVQQQDLTIKVRGFTGVQATRDYFPLGIISPDRYNIDRVDLNRGPNSILYGIGGPGGVINTSTKQALLDNRQKSISVTIGSYNKKRTELDLAFPVIKDRLAMRVNGLLEDRDGWRDFEFLKQKAIAVAATYKLFENTRVRANFENNDRDQNVPFVWPAKNLGASKWIAAGSPMAGDPLQPRANPAPGILRSRNQFQVVYAPQLRDQPFRLASQGVDMRPDLAGNQTAGYWETVPGPASPGISGIVDDLDFGTVPRRANLMGAGNRSDQNYSAGTLILDHHIGNLFIEVAYNRRNWYRESRFPLGWNQNGVIGDANPVLPGAYFADGSLSAQGGRNPGTLLPDIGAVNPHAGDLYVEGQASYRYRAGADENYRASLAYELDLTNRNRWFGRHSFASVLQRNDGWNATQVQREFNLTPNNSDPIDATHNQIVRRTYLDFHSPDGMRGALDPWSNPIPTSTGVTAGFVSAGSDSLRSIKEDTAMVAVQSRFFDDRLAMTGGYRRDTQRTHLATLGAEKLPNSNNLWIKQSDQFDPALESKFSGNTKTFGLVVTPWTWLGFSYNRADSVQPQGVYDMIGRPVGIRKGEGEDFGVRINMFGGRVSLTANAYDTNDVNQLYAAALIQTNVVPAVNAVLETLSRAGDPLPGKFAGAGMTRWWNNGRDRVDNEGDGYEVELVGNLTGSWSISGNYSRSNRRISNVAADLNQFMRDVQGEWQNNARFLYQTPSQVAAYVATRDNTSGRDFATNPATFRDAYEAAMSAVTATNKQNGQAPLLHVRDSLNLFTSYRFGADAPALLKRARAGFGGNFRGPAVIGYDESRNDAPFKGVSNFTASLMLGKNFPLKDRRSFDVQVNIFNLFAREDLLPYAATPFGDIVRWMYPRTRRSFDLRMVYRF